VYHEGETVARSSSRTESCDHSPILVLATSQGTSNKLTTPKSNTPTTFSMLAHPEAQTHASLEGKWYAPYPRLSAPT
jgi:hypothetical protein